MTFKLVPKKTGLAALREAEEAARREAGTLTTTKSPEQQKREAGGYIEPDKAPDRIKIIFDDSGSMSGQKIKDARQGCIEFLRYCAKNQVAVAVHPICKDPLALDTNLPELAALIEFIQADGFSTPMFETLDKAQKEEIKATRYIVFSDGQADSESLMEKCINRALDQKTPVDTVYVAAGESHLDYARQVLKDLAERTGGIFLAFDRNKVNFGQAFKFLAPGMRHMLASESFREDLQQGKVKL